MLFEELKIGNLYYVELKRYTMHLDVDEIYYKLFIRGIFLLLKKDNLKELQFSSFGAEMKILLEDKIYNTYFEIFEDEQQNFIDLIKNPNFPCKEPIILINKF